MEIEMKKIRRMKALMGRLQNKTFNEDDRLELNNLAAHFLYCTVAMTYTNGYTLK